MGLLFIFVLFSLSEKASEISQLKAEVDSRKTEVTSKEREISRFKLEMDGKKAEMSSLQRELDIQKRKNNVSV